MQELVSVIIPVYNVEKYLPKCLDSIVNQTYNNLQIILVNDGTKDNSLEICQEYQNRDCRIQIINKENGGLSSARNKGLEYAEGKYCLFIDSDDYVELDLIENAVGRMEEENADLVVFGFDRFCEGIEDIETFRVQNEIDEINNPKNRLHFIADTYYQYKIAYEVWNKIYRLDIIKKYDIWYEDNHIIFAEDICFNSYYMMYVNKVVKMDKVLYHYLIRDDSLTGGLAGMIKPKVQKFHVLLQYIYTYMLNNDDSKYLINHFEYLYASLLHDQYKRVTVGEIPENLYEVENMDFFRQMSERAYKSRWKFPGFFGFKIGDLLIDECFIVYHRNQKKMIMLASKLIQTKRMIRTLLKNKLK